MPTYEYKCKKCGHKFEKFHKMNDDSIKTCPECGCEAERLIGAGSGLIFKGAGFHATDYANSRSSCCGSDSKPDSCASGKCCQKD